VQHSEYELAHERLEGGLQFIIFIERYVLLVVTADEVGLFALKFLDKSERGLYQLVGTEFDFEQDFNEDFSCYGQIFCHS
jgi:hypothetical protein